MKRIVTLLGLSLMFLATVAFAQRGDEDRRVRFTQGPDITNITGESASMSWATYGNRAYQVRYREAGSNYAWQSASVGGGGTSQSARLRGLRPGRTYEWQIVERDGDVLGAGQFQTARSRRGRAPDVLAQQPYQEGDRGYDRDHDRGYRGNRVALYRGLRDDGGHMFSVNPDETTSRGYRSEGTAAILVSSQERGTTPLFRLFGNERGDSFLTTDPNERDRALSQGYMDQGIVGYIATSQLPGTVPFYRLYNSFAGQHFYTISAPERDSAIRNGMGDEGVAGFVWQ